MLGYGILHSGCLLPQGEFTEPNLVSVFLMSVECSRYASLYYVQLLGNEELVIGYVNTPLRGSAHAAGGIQDAWSPCIIPFLAWLLPSFLPY